MKICALLRNQKHSFCVCVCVQINLIFCVHSIWLASGIITADIKAGSRFVEHAKSGVVIWLFEIFSTIFTVNKIITFVFEFRFVYRLGQPLKLKSMVVVHHCNAENVYFRKVLWTLQLKNHKLISNTYIQLTSNFKLMNRHSDEIKISTKWNEIKRKNTIFVWWKGGIHWNSNNGNYFNFHIQTKLFSKNASVWDAFWLRMQFAREWSI